MISYLANRFALTEKGAKDLLKGIIYTTLLNIGLLLPMSLYVLLLYQLIDPLLSGSFLSPSLGMFIILILLVLGIIFVLQWKQYYYVYTTTYTESDQRRINLAESLRKIPLSFFENRDLSDLSATIMEDCTGLEHTFSHAVPQLAGSVIAMILIAIGLLFFDYRLAIALLWVVPVSFIIIYLSKSLNQKGGNRVINNSRAVTDNIQEFLESISDLKAYSYEKKYLANLTNKLHIVETSKIKSELMSASGVVIGQMFLKLGIVSVMVVGAHLILNNQVSIVTFLIFLIAAANIFTPMENALMFIAEIFNSDLKINRMNNIENQVLTGGSVDYSLNSYDIKFNNVNFAYDDSKDVLNNINFLAKQGEVTALVGPSGGGKSTVSKLAAKFWNPNSGAVSLGGVDLATVDSEEILKSYSIVFQDVVLFNDTVMENIRIGSRDASDEEIIRVAKLAQCDDFINNLPDGYNTVIGENGFLLSGGERQRISIARALLKDAPIILLDEATSFLDVENESKIQKALSVLIKNKTVLVIAHRMRTIANADKIVVLDNGSVVEEGSSEELIADNGLFAKMVAIQNKSNNWEI